MQQTRDIWRSLHQDYLQFAADSLHRAIGGGEPEDAFINRIVAEAIRYSYDCLEASIEFVWRQGHLAQLPMDVPSTWLTRYLDRKWKGLSATDKYGLLTFAWKGCEFWRSPEELGLFVDLKKVRDGLTHPRPFGQRWTEEILGTEDVDGFTFTHSRSTKEPESLDPKLLRSDKPIASFGEAPDELAVDDARQAVEILLLHLIRIEQLYYGRPTTQFAIYDRDNNGRPRPGTC